MQKIRCIFVLIIVLLLFACQPVFANTDIVSTAHITFPNNGYEENNNYNANLAAQLVNGYVLQPGEIFSFNEVVGPRTEDRGFIYGLDAGKNPDLGSGICRLSTELYQAAEYAGMKILERHSHYPPVEYAVPGTDAAIMWQAYDLKFMNTLGHPVAIKTAMYTDDSGYHLWTVFLNKKEHTPVEVQSVVGQVYHALNGVLINDKTYVPIDQLTDLYKLQYSQDENNGILEIQVYGHVFSELNGDIWHTSQGVAVPIRKWVQMFGGKLKWWPLDNKVTLWTS